MLGFWWRRTCIGRAPVVRVEWAWTRQTFLTEGDSVKDVRARTVVFTLERGEKIKPGHFLSTLDVVKGMIEALGTVGVGYVWHVTCLERMYAEAPLLQGDFKIDLYEVKVTALSISCTTAVLYWLPFWVPHNDLETCLNSMLPGKVLATYVRIPQKGFDGCFSTQRRIHSTVDFQGLPHFITVKSRGVSHRCLLFVPGRL